MNVFQNHDPTSRYQNYQREFWLIQDIMSCELLLSMISQILTLQKRGDTINSLLYPGQWLCLAIFFTLVVHLVVMGARAATRAEARVTEYSYGNSGDYTSLNWTVWVALLLLPVGGIFVGGIANAHDDRHHKRYLQFLRLDFETKLGQHSPR
jgi:uncharacterized membrane protein YjgN (DUF898 family)